MMKEIDTIVPHVDELEFFRMPDVRVIGKAIVCKLHSDANPVPDFWGRFFDEGCKGVVDRLPHAIPNAMVGWTGNYVAETDCFTYIVGIYTPAGTPVPEGFDFRDLPASTVAKGLFGEGVHETVGRLVERGYETAYSDLGWNAELYVDEELCKATNGDHWRWLVPCAKTQG